MINEQSTRFEAIAIMNKSIKRTTPESWVLEFDGVIVGEIKKVDGGYKVFSMGVTTEPFAHFAKAISSMIHNFMRCAQYLRHRKELSDAIEAMQPRVKYFAANPNNDPYVITLRRDEHCALSVLTNEGISDFTWCDIHTAKLPKTIVMIPDYISAKHEAERVIERVNRDLGNQNSEHPFFKREIRVMRFSEATSENIKHYMRLIDEMTLGAHSLGGYNA